MRSHPGYVLEPVEKATRRPSWTNVPGKRQEPILAYPPSAEAEALQAQMQVQQEKRSGERDDAATQTTGGADAEDGDAVMH